MTLKFPWLLTGLLTTFFVVLPSEAASLKTWNFNKNSNRLDLTTDNNVRPVVNLIFNPTRLVVDLPGIKLQNPETIRRRFDSVVEEVRVGLVDNKTTRLVIALAPGYTLDPQKIKVRGYSPRQWTIQLPTSASKNGANIPLNRGNITPKGNVFAGVVPLKSEIWALKRELLSVVKEYRSLSVGMFFLDVDTGEHIDIGGARVFPAASTIKMPILIALFQDVDSGRVKLNQTLVMRRKHVTGGSGTLQYKRVGAKLSVLDTASRMIIISDNTATNMIIDRMGGIARLNSRFRSWGLRDTVMRNWLADLRGTNKTSSKDLARVLTLVSKRRLISDGSRQKVLGILRRTKTRTLLPSGIGPGARIAHKTGDIGFLVGDAGLVEMPGGKRYVGVVFVRRPYDSPLARKFVKRVSRLVYNYLDKGRVIAFVEIEGDNSELRSLKDPDSKID
ncbi:serine hydrolase [Merismopedia glauca]|uniref:Serine hydrolase n=1 Tax=Merismopedia glauca CCAP 1448/3 TaxID=1296344 RepID=A0A2T1BX38_9CYAN|nr:serine hydrolase [Merismopedia glauca]PSB00493.1 serine hydrolase [Merismopedia glauca CCAP 1448/3]